MTQSRTHTCNELRIEHAGQAVRLAGWLENVRRVSKNLAFLVLREAIPGNMLAGIACILCGSLVSILPGLLAQRRAAALPVTEGTVKEEVEV